MLKHCISRKWLVAMTSSKIIISTYKNVSGKVPYSNVLQNLKLIHIEMLKSWRLRLLKLLQAYMMAAMLEENLCRSTDSAIKYADQSIMLSRHSNCDWYTMVNIYKTKTDNSMIGNFVKKADHTL